MNPAIRRKSFWARRLAILTSALVVLSGLSWLGDWHWLADLCSHFAFHYALAGLIFAVLLTAARRYGWAAVAFSVFLLNALLVSPYWHNPRRLPPESGRNESIRILHFNVKKNNNRIPEITRWLRVHKEDIDIAVLVETTGAWRRHLSDLRQDYPHQTSELLEGSFGITVLSRLVPDEIEAVHLNADAMPSVRLTAKTRKEGIAFVLYAAHPPPPINGLLSRLRNRQLLSLARSIATEPMPVRLLVGDLNITVWSAWYRRMTRLAGLRSAQYGTGYAGTWPNFDAVPAWLRIPIDHVLVSENVRTRRWALGPSFDSDHASILTTLRLYAEPVSATSIR